MADPRRPTPARSAALLLLPVLLLLAACARVPSSGEVVRLDQESAAAAEGSDRSVRIFAQRPRPGYSQEQIVQGFLEALVSDDDDFSTARAYLTPAEAGQWHPDAGITLFDTGLGGLERRGEERIALVGQLLAQVGTDGSYQPVDPASRLDVTFVLSRVGEEWRIADAPDGLLLSAFDFERVYRAVTLYFYDAQHRVLVPDRVWLRSGTNQVAGVVRALLRGPSQWLSPAVSTAFPQGSRLREVTVERGVTRIDFDQSVGQVDPEVQQRLTAQLVWTLNRLAVTPVEVTAGGDRLDFDSGDRPQTVDDWREVRPRQGTDRPYGYLQKEQELMVVTGPGQVSEAPGPLGRQPMTDYAFSLVSDEAVAISPDGRLLLTRVADGARLTPLAAPEGHLASPSWDALERLWVVRERAEIDEIWVRAPDGEFSQVDTSVLADQRIATTTAHDSATRVAGMRVAPDGTRIALLLGPDADHAELFVGRLEPTVRPEGTTYRLNGLHRVIPGASTVASVAWDGAERLAVLVREGDTGGLRPLLVPVDGAGRTPVESWNNLRQMAAAHDHLLLAVTGEGAVLQQQQRGGAWIEIGAGQRVFYPG